MLMRTTFAFFLRLFICFVAAKFILRVLEVESRSYLVGLTLLFTANVYWFDYLGFRERIFFRSREQERSHPQEAQESEEASPKLSPPEG
jgi:hypothetical protein